MKRRGYCILIDTLFQGPVISVFDENDKPVVFSTVEEAQREMADNMITRLQQFLEGEREFEDAITCDEYVVEVEISSDGFVLQAESNLHSPN